MAPARAAAAAERGRERESGACLARSNGTAVSPMRVLLCAARVRETRKSSLARVNEKKRVNFVRVILYRYIIRLFVRCSLLLLLVIVVYETRCAR